MINQNNIDIVINVLMTLGAVVSSAYIGAWIDRKIKGGKK